MFHVKHLLEKKQIGKSNVSRETIGKIEKIESAIIEY